MSYNYVVTAQKPTAVTHCLTANFTSGKDLNLIISKWTRLEILTITADGLQPVTDIGLYGKVVIMQTYRPQGSDKDYLFLLFDRYAFTVLSYNETTGLLDTVANGELNDKIGRKVECGHTGAINASSTIIALRLYEGLLKIIPVVNTPTSCQLKEAFNLRIEELLLIDMCFIHHINSSTASSSTSSSSHNTIALLYEDNWEQRHVKTYNVMVGDKDLVDGPFTQHNVESTAKILIPVSAPTGGLIILGEELVTYHSGTYTKSLPICNRSGPTSTSVLIAPQAWCKIDTHRYLIGDHHGRMFILLLERSGESGTVELHMDYIGETSIPRCLAFLGGSMVYVGASFTDSQLIRLVPQGGGGTAVELIEQYTNLGPICDFVVVDLDRQGQGQVVTCSGAHKDGSIRVIRNGIGINELASLELTGVKGMWSLMDLASSNDMTEGDDILEAKYLVLSFLHETKVLSMADEESIEEAQVPGLAADQRTLLCSNVASIENPALTNFYIQVTPKSVRLISIQAAKLVQEWVAPEGCTINMASCNAPGGQILLAGTGGHLFYMVVTNGELKLQKETKMPHEVACIDIHPFHQELQASRCIVGLWVDVSICIFNLPDLSLAHKEALSSDVLPRSVLACAFEGVDYLLCGLGDGNLLVYTLEDGKIQTEKKLTIGSQPITLSLFTSASSSSSRTASQPHSQQHVFVSSDRPTVMYTSNRKLLFSNVNLKEVQFVCQFNNRSLQHDNCLALMNDDNLVLGTIDSIQKLHIRTIPIGERPNQICYHNPSQTFALLTARSPGCTSTMAGSGNLLNEASSPGASSSTNPVMMDHSMVHEEVHYVRLLSNHTFECLNTYQLDANEHGCSMITTTFDGDETEYLVVGTAYVVPEETEPSRGRILVFEVKDGRLLLVTEKDIKGCCNALNSFNGKLLSVANAKIQLWKWQYDGNKALEYECYYHGHIVTLTLQSRGDYIIFGDLMRSISVLLYKPDEGALEEIAHDVNPHWITATEVLGDDIYIGAENHCNLYTVGHNTDSTNEDEQRMLNILGQFHLGEFVNQFRKGSLVMQMMDQESTAKDPFAIQLSPYSLIYGGVSGSIGIINPISEQLYHYILAIQTAIGKVIKAVGGLHYDTWRNFSNDRKTTTWKHFLDGDLIEQFLDLPREQMEEVVKHLKTDAKEAEASPPTSMAAQVAAALPKTVDELIKKVEDFTRLH